MNTNLTELVFILDRSGSMSGLEKDTIGGYNALIEKQKKESGDALVSTVLFNSHATLIHDRIPLTEVSKLTENDYYVGGCTALLDAVGSSLQHIDAIHQKMKEEDVPGKTLFVITTDGMENDSREYTYDQVKRLIEKKKECGWEFIFLGANIDAVKEASRFGIEEGNAANYHCDSRGVSLNYEALGEAIASVRKTGSVKKDWRKPIDRDFQIRNKGRD